MHIHDNRAVQDATAPAEVAIINESVGSKNMAVSLDITLGGQDNTFGVVLRAKDPREWVEAVDQIQVNRYFYALFGRDTVALYYHEPGKEELLIKSAEIPAKESFRVVASVYGDQFRIYRDGQEILDAVDSTLPSDTGDFLWHDRWYHRRTPTTADNFLGRRYGGEYANREWAPSAAVFRGANVHYNPLYFQQIALERYGQHFGSLFAPWIAHALSSRMLPCFPIASAKAPPDVPERCRSLQAGGHRSPSTSTSLSRTREDFPPGDSDGPQLVAHPVAFANTLRVVRNLGSVYQ